MLPPPCVLIYRSWLITLKEDNVAIFGFLTEKQMQEPQIGFALVVIIHFSDQIYICTITDEMEFERDSLVIQPEKR